MDSQQKKSKQKFTREEDELIINCVKRMKEIEGKISWIKVAKQLPSRTNKQVRERYLTYLSPSININPLSTSELKLLVEIVFENANFCIIPWKKIAKSFPGRSDIFLKNQYNYEKMKLLKNDFYSDLEQMEQMEYDQNFWNNIEFY
jgi:hypothetical protein